MYKIITISLYDEDIVLLDEKVFELRHRGFHKANKSAIIRYAIRKLKTEDIDLITFREEVAEHGEEE